MILELDLPEMIARMLVKIAEVRGRFSALAEGLGRIKNLICSQVVGWRAKAPPGALQPGTPTGLRTDSAAAFQR